VEIAFFIGTGILFLILLTLWTMKSAVRDMAVHEKTMSQAILSDFRIDLPSKAVTHRIFAAADWQYIVSYGKPDLAELFLRERKNVAQAWIRRTRSGVEAVIRLRKSVARMHRNSRLSIELSVMMNYAGFLLLCRVVSMLIWWKGPFVLHTIALHASDTAEDISIFCGKALGNLSAEQRHRIQRQWAS
jgi:hypothetical protein